MNDSKQVTWFADEVKPNRFFFRSAFRSPVFQYNTFLLAALIVGYGVSLAKTWPFWRSHDSHIFLFSILLAQAGVYPFIRAVRRHRQINEIYSADKIAEQPAGSPMNDVLQAAENAINHGLSLSLILTGVIVFLLFTVVPKALSIR